MAFALGRTPPPLTHYKSFFAVWKALKLFDAEQVEEYFKGPDSKKNPDEIIANKIRFQEILKSSYNFNVYLDPRYDWNNPGARLPTRQEAIVLINKYLLPNQIKVEMDYRLARFMFGEQIMKVDRQYDKNLLILLVNCFPVLLTLRYTGTHPETEKKYTGGVLHWIQFHSDVHSSRSLIDSFAKINKYVLACRDSDGRTAKVETQLAYLYKRVLAVVEEKPNSLEAPVPEESAESCLPLTDFRLLKYT